MKLVENHLDFFVHFFSQPGLWLPNMLVTSSYQTKLQLQMNHFVTKLGDVTLSKLDSLLKLFGSFCVEGTGELAQIEVMKLGPCILKVAHQINLFEIRMTYFEVNSFGECNHVSRTFLCHAFLAIGTQKESRVPKLLWYLFESKWLNHLPQTKARLCAAGLNF